MRKYKFNLEKVLKIKIQDFDLLLEQLIKLREQHTNQHHLVNKLSQHFNQINEELSHEMIKGISGFELNKFKYQKELIHKQLKEETKLLEELENKVEEKLKQVINKKQEVSSLEKLDEKKFEKYKQELKKIEELNNDELLSFKIHYKNI